MSPDARDFPHGVEVARALLTRARERLTEIENSMNDLDKSRVRLTVNRWKELRRPLILEKVQVEADIQRLKPYASGPTKGAPVSSTAKLCWLSRILRDAREWDTAAKVERHRRACLEAVEALLSEGGAS